jgi:dTDP-4-amino-4,6-dideoxyglucose
LGDLPGISFQKITPGGHSSYNYFGMLVEADRFGLSNRELEKSLKADLIGTKVYYHPPVHQQQAYRTDPPTVLPHTEGLTARIICLPMYNDMDESLLERIAASVRRIHNHGEEVHATLSAKAVHA